MYDEVEEISSHPLDAMLKISTFEESIVMKPLVGLAKIPIHFIQKYSSSHLPYEAFCALVGIFRRSYPTS